MYGTPQERAQKNSRLSDYTLCENMVIATLAPQQIREEWATELQKRQTNCNHQWERTGGNYSMDISFYICRLCNAYQSR